MESLRHLSICKGLDKEKIVECVSKGLHNSFGSSESRDLTLLTLSVVYGLDEKDIPSLDLIEWLIEKVFGESAAHMILNNIANECKKYYMRN